MKDNKPNTAADKQILCHLFDGCHVYHFGVKGPVETLGKHSTTPVTKTMQSQFKPLPCQMSRSTSGKNTPWEHRDSVRFPKDMLS